MTKSECKKELKNIEKELTELIQEAIKRVMPCGDVNVLSKLFEIIRLAAVLRSEISLTIKNL